MDITLYLKREKELIETFLAARMNNLKQEKRCPHQLQKAMDYSLMAGGKRIRPIFCMASYRACGGKSDGIVPVASALELIHTYSLIHDDLPAMDNDDFRRSKPTSHKVFGEATAILAGDALLTDAFSIIAESALDPGILLKVIHELSHACGPEGMVGGQIVDILFEGKKATKEDLLYIHTHKTGALIRGAIRIGAFMANAGQEKLSSLTTYGEKMGLAFQVVDDILDITASQEELGKPAGSDGLKGKNTYPSLFGLDESMRIADALLHDSLAAIEDFEGDAEVLRELAAFILKRRN
jgi:geranylgeranyl diphosphate synthase type II